MKIIFSLIILVVLFVFYVWYLEDHSIFFPDREIINTPGDIGLNYDDVYFQTMDHVKLNGWFIRTPLAQSTLLYFHGNAGNIGDRLEKIAHFASIGMNIFIVDYRGYGNSEGKPTEAGLYQDALAAYEYLTDHVKISPDQIILYGESLGGVAAIDLASKRKVAGIIVDSTFSHAADMAKVILPIAPSYIVRTKMDSLSKIPNIKVPKLFIHSRDDATVPYALGRKLFEAATAPKDFLEMTGGHNDIHVVDEIKYWNGIKFFLKQYGNIAK